MPLRWNKVWIADATFESARVCDVNNDGVPDIVSGAFWYQGPDFRTKHCIGPVHAEGEYYDEFSAIPLDVNGDGHIDIITGGWWGGTLRWRENPGAAGTPWPEHIIAHVGNIETTRAWDLDGDGRLEIIPNTPGARELRVFKLHTDAAGHAVGSFDQHTIFAGEAPQGHGLGCGDIAGNGRADIVLANGWWEAPADIFGSAWQWHPEFTCGWPAASVPMLVADVNGDGCNDLIVGNAHGYGLVWLEQRLGRGGARSWITHPIDPFNAQYHDMHWVDLDGDGACELVTGKRHRAHCGNDPGEWDDYGMYYFKWNGESFTKHVIEYGPIGHTKGCGIECDVYDLRGTGRLDLVLPGKDGLWVFYNEGL